MITIDSNTLTKFAKAIPSDMRHTQKLDAFAKILGYPDQTALMADLKRKEALAAPAPEAPPAEPHVAEAAALGVPTQYTLDRKIREIFEADIRSLPEDEAIYDKDEWREDISRGDTHSGYEEWLEQQIENVLENVGIYHFLCGYLRWEVVNGAVVLNASQRNSETLESAAENVLSFWKIAGGEDAIGEEVMDILEEIMEDVRERNKGYEVSRRDMVDRLMDSVHQCWVDLQNDSESVSRRDMVDRLMGSVHQCWVDLQNDSESPSPD